MEIKRPFAANGFLWNSAKQEVLLHLRDGNTKHHPHQWSFFGGKGEGQETPVACFIREVGEELLISIRPEDAVLLREYPAEEGYHQYSFYVESDMPKSAMTLTEGADFDWVLLEKVFDYDLSPEARISLESFVKKHI